VARRVLGAQGAAVVAKAQTPNNADAASSLIGLILTSDNTVRVGDYRHLPTALEVERAEVTANRGGPSQQSPRGLSSAEAPDMSRPGTEPVKPGKAVDAREMAKMPEAAELAEAV